jgi:hypothetical protein
MPQRRAAVAETALKVAAKIKRARHLPLPEEVTTLLQHLNSIHFTQTDLPWSFPDRTDLIGALLWDRRTLGTDSETARHAAAGYVLSADQESDEIAHGLAAEQAPLNPTRNIDVKLRGWAWSNGREWLTATGRIVDVWCCSNCRHFFISKHGRQRFCSDRCQQQAARIGASSVLRVGTGPRRHDSRWSRRRSNTSRRPVICDNRDFLIFSQDVCTPSV